MPFTEEQRHYMVELYLQTNSPFESKLKFDEEYYPITVSITGIREILKKEGCKLQPKGGRRHGLSLDGLIELCKECKGDVQLMSKDSGNSIRGLIIRCCKEKLEINNIPKNYKPRKSYNPLKKYFFRKKCNR